MTEPKPDLELTIVKNHDGKMVVMDGGDWKRLSFESMEDIPKGATPPSLIDIDAELLFSGWEGPIFDGYKEAMKPDLDKRTWVPINLQDIINRLFKIIDGSPATFRLWAGENVERIVDSVETVMYFELIEAHKRRPNVHIGTTPEHESKLDSIRHLCGGTFTRKRNAEAKKEINEMLDQNIDPS